MNDLAVDLATVHVRTCLICSRARLERDLSPTHVRLRFRIQRQVNLEAFEKQMTIQTDPWVHEPERYQQTCRRFPSHGRHSHSWSDRALQRVSGWGFAIASDYAPVTHDDGAVSAIGRETGYAERGAREASDYANTTGCRTTTIPIGNRTTTATATMTSTTNTNANAFGRGATYGGCATWIANVSAASLPTTARRVQWDCHGLRHAQLPLARQCCRAKCSIHFSAPRFATPSATKRCRLPTGPARPEIYDLRRASDTAVHGIEPFIH